MNKQDPEEDNAESSITFVYLPDEDVYGTIKSHGAWASLIEYNENGVQYVIEVSNDDFIEVNEIGIGYIGEEEL